VCLTGNTRAAEAFSRAFSPDESADIAYLHEFLVMNPNLLLISL
jgi:hypothetical protein